VGWFGRRDKDAHHRSLADARQLIERYRIAQTTSFDLGTVPVEFRAALYPRLENLLWHIEHTAESELGDAQSMQELVGDLGFVHVLCSGKFSEETQRNFRTSCFEGAVEGLADMVERPDRFRGTVVEGLKSGMLANRIEWVETTLAWFSERPSPQSKKYNAEQTRAILSLGRQALESLRRTNKSSSAGAQSVTPKVCPKCAKENGADAGFRKSCGQALASPVCSVCNLQNDADATFCNRCGNRVGVHADAPARTPSLPTRHQQSECPVIVRLRECPKCGTSNRGDAYKCSKCGRLMRTQA
jgi:hypothetical protein